ncbi:MAG: murein transglycosylase, partial [Cyanothece sp. SIO1E1]|nr:murein transglycosylase [Cyanothece sp. SIO1E1]
MGYALQPSQANPPLQPIELIDLNHRESQDEADRLGFDDNIWDQPPQSGDWQALLSAVNHSLDYLKTPAALQAYGQYPIPGITRERVYRSLSRFRQLLLTTYSASALQAAVQAEFEFYQAIGRDGEGTVDFTGYFEPTYAASRVPTSEYRYPLYRKPPDLEQWAEPHPTRVQLEGADGLQGSQGPLQGLELVWLRDRLEAFLVQVQGSARLQMTDGSTLTIGYAGRTDYTYTSVGKALVETGIFSLEALTLPKLIAYFCQHPDQLNHYLPLNQRFVFFQST